MPLDRTKAIKYTGRFEESMPATFGQFTELELLAPNLPGGGPEGAIRELTRRLESTGRIRNAAAFLSAALAREIQQPMFMGQGVVVPHVRSGDALKLSVAIGLAGEGIAWDGHGTARVVFLFAVPLTEAGRYLLLLSGLSRLMQNKAAFAALQQGTQPEEMWQALHKIRLPG
jgi:mannitol/fructose-specific phosphotransferase system IIA component (Ntr-type)